jgi:hypothetical protein
MQDNLGLMDENFTSPEALWRENRALPVSK